MLIKISYLFTTSLRNNKSHRYRTTYPTHGYLTRRSLLWQNPRDRPPGTGSLVIAVSYTMSARVVFETGGTINKHKQRKTRSTFRVNLRGRWTNNNLHRHESNRFQLYSEIIRRPNRLQCRLNKLLRAVCEVVTRSLYGSVYLLFSVYCRVIECGI